MTTLRIRFARTAAATFFAALAGCSAASDRGSPGALPPQTSARSTAQPDRSVHYVGGAPSFAGDIASDDSGGEWFSECDSSIARIDETSHKFTQFNTSSAKSCDGGVALGRNRTAMWFTDPHDNKVGFIWLKSHKFNVYTIPTHNAGVYFITAGPDNAMWFTESNVGRIGRIDLSKHPFKITEYALAHRNDGPLGIALGADGALWFAENGGIGRITTAHQISFYRDDTYTYGSPRYITAGPDGALWFTTYYGKDFDYVGRIDPYTHKFSHPTGDPSLGPITQRGADLWVAGEPTRYSGNYYGYVYAINAKTHHRYKPVYLGDESDPNGIALGLDCNLWVTDPALDRIWYVTPSDKC